VEQRISAGDTAFIAELRALLASHRPEAAPVPGRVGSIILRARPAFAVTAGNMPGLDTMSPHLLPPAVRQELPRLRQLAADLGPSVGRIETQDATGKWTPVGTGFVAGTPPGGATRILTAGHVAGRLIRRPVLLRRLTVPPRISRAAGTLVPSRVVFDDAPDGSAGSVATFDSLIWAHGTWDLLICELDRALALPPVPLETDPDWAQVEEEAVAVLGYPIEARARPPGTGHDPFEAVFQGPLGIKRMAPGLLTNARAAPRDLPPDEAGVGNRNLRHDATTLSGSSGSPVLSLRTGRAIGLHFGGGVYVPESVHEAMRAKVHADANLCVNLPVALLEGRLAAEIAQVPPPTPLPEPHFPASTRVWNRETVAADGTLESRFDVGRLREVPPAALAAVARDRPDDRDMPYLPPVITVRNAVSPPAGYTPFIYDQDVEPACVGCALAGAIENLLHRRDGRADRVSARMLQEMALAHDEWIEDGPGGTSLRAGIKGFHTSGVCLNETAPFVPRLADWRLNRAAADKARAITLGAYYRLMPRLPDFQTAIEQVGVILVAAHVHDGWLRRDRRGAVRIRPQARKLTARDRPLHAILIVGYDEEGFIVQNSWGKGWSTWNGRQGEGHWSYADWRESLVDAWVLQLAPRAPAGFDARVPGDRTASHAFPSGIAALPRPRRYQLLGRIAQVERDGVVTSGRLGLGLPPLREAGLALAAAPGSFPHLALVYHDPFLDAEALSRIAAYLSDGFERNGIAALHIVYGADEVETIRARLTAEAGIVANRFRGSAAETSGYLARRARTLCDDLLARYEEGAELAARQGGALWRASAAFCIEAVPGRSLHLLGFGAGMIALHAERGQALERGSPALGLTLSVGGLGPRSSGLPPPDRAWALAPDLGGAALLSYTGDWVDLLHAMRGSQDRPGPHRLTGPVRGAPCTGTSDIASACVSHTLLNRIVQEITGTRPRGTRAFAAP
jgi:hypothetical protein